MNTTNFKDGIAYINFENNLRAQLAITGNRDSNGNIILNESIEIKLRLLNSEQENTNYVEFSISGADGMAFIDAEIKIEDYHDNFGSAEIPDFYQM